MAMEHEYIRGFAAGENDGNRIAAIKAIAARRNGYRKNPDSFPPIVSFDPWINGYRAGRKYALLRANNPQSTVTYERYRAARYGEYCTRRALAVQRGEV